MLGTSLENIHNIKRKKKIKFSSPHCQFPNLISRVCVMSGKHYFDYALHIHELWRDKLCYLWQQCSPKNNLAIYFRFLVCHFHFCWCCEWLVSVYYLLWWDISSGCLSQMWQLTWLRQKCHWKVVHRSVPIFWITDRAMLFNVHILNNLLFYSWNLNVFCFVW